MVLVGEVPEVVARHRMLSVDEQITTGIHHLHFSAQMFYLQIGVGGFGKA